MKRLIYLLALLPLVLGGCSSSSEESIEENSIYAHLNGKYVHGGSAKYVENGKEYGCWTTLFEGYQGIKDYYGEGKIFVYKLYLFKDAMELFPELKPFYTINNIGYYTVNGGAYVEGEEYKFVFDKKKCYLKIQDVDIEFADGDKIPCDNNSYEFVEADTIINGKRLSIDRNGLEYGEVLVPFSSPYKHEPIIYNIGYFDYSTVNKKISKREYVLDCLADEENNVLILENDEFTFSCKVDIEKQSVSIKQIHPERLKEKSFDLKK